MIAKLRAAEPALLGLLVAAGLAGLVVDPPVPGLVVVALGVTLIVAQVTRRRADAGQPEPLDPGRAAELRAHRDREGELAAVRALRRQRPELSLVDAVTLVRDL